MNDHPLELTRSQILAQRRRSQELDERLPAGRDSLRRAAWAGLQDSVPRSALHSLHARVEAVSPDAWEDRSLVQVWGPRYTAFVVPADEHAPFTLGRLPETGATRKRAEDLAARLHLHLHGRRTAYGAAGEALGVHPNSLRYAALTGTVLIRWEGARQPTIWTVPRPKVDSTQARLDLARRYLHVLGPSTAESFATWAGIDGRAAIATFDALPLVAVRTPLGSQRILAEDEAAFRSPATAPAAARLLPSGDPYYLLQGADRELLVPEPEHRALLWTPRVWPGALLVGGEVVGTWRRSQATVTVQAWGQLSATERGAVEAEAFSLPLPALDRPIDVRWAT
jgi:hypothetical protein